MNKKEELNMAYTLWMICLVFSISAAIGIVIAIIFQALPFDGMRLIGLFVIGASSIPSYIMLQSYSRQIDELSEITKETTNERL